MRMAKITELAQRNAASQDSDKETVAQANSSKHLGLSSQFVYVSWSFSQIRCKGVKRNHTDFEFEFTVTILQHCGWTWMTPKYTIVLMSWSNHCASLPNQSRCLFSCFSVMLVCSLSNARKPAAFSQCKYKNLWFVGVQCHAQGHFSI